MQSYSTTEEIAQLSSWNADRISPTISEDEDSLSSGTGTEEITNEAEDSITENRPRFTL